MTLDEIAIKHGTDKATRHPTGAHGYAPVYERAFQALSDQPIKLLEIGVGGGESIKTWLDFFPAAKVFGIDTVKNTNVWNSPATSPNERYRFVHGDQSDPVMWKCFLADCGGSFDIIIDDGGHKNSEIIISFTSMWPQVKAGGFYCIEDLAVGYGAGSVFLVPGFPAHMDFIRSLLDNINATSDLESLHFSKELAIIKKKAPPCTPNIAPAGPADTDQK